MITDLSTNGTFLNGIKLTKDTPSQIKSGDLIGVIILKDTKKDFKVGFKIC